MRAVVQALQGEQAVLGRAVGDECSAVGRWSVAWRGGGGCIATGPAAAGYALTFGVLFLCLQILRLQTPEDGLQKVRAFPQHFHPRGHLSIWPYG